MKIISSFRGGRKAAFFLSILLFFVITVFFWVLPHEVDRRNNSLGVGITENPPAAIPELHSSLRIVDLHADTLLWDRDLLARAKRGHVDLPRLQEGPVTLQVFSVVTSTPRRINYQANSANGDNITLLAVAQRWPFATWSHLSERALYQARRLKEASDESEGQLRFIRTAEDLKKFLKDREKNPLLVAAILAMEGAQALEGDLHHLDEAEAAGFRMISSAHLTDSEISGSQQGVGKGGLTTLGREWVQKMNQKKMIIDLAHVSTKAIDEILEISSRPSVVSHTGVKAVCDSNRNLSDEQLKKIATKGGLIGIGFWKEVNCGPTLAHVAKSIRHAVMVAGIDHVALGSDWDGFVDSPIDASRVGWLTAQLVKDGFQASEIQKIMGENALRFFLDNLPDGP